MRVRVDIHHFVHLAGGTLPAGFEELMNSFQSKIDSLRSAVEGL